MRKGLIGLCAGLGIGGLAGYFIGKNVTLKKSNEEIEAIRNYYKQKYRSQAAEKVNKAHEERTEAAKSDEKVSKFAKTDSIDLEKLKDDSGRIDYHAISGRYLASDDEDLSKIVPIESDIFRFDLVEEAKFMESDKKDYISYFVDEEILADQCGNVLDFDGFDLGDRITEAFGTGQYEDDSIVYVEDNASGIVYQICRETCSYDTVYPDREGET